MGQLATQKEKLDSVRDLLARADVMDAIAKVAPKHLTPDRITRIAMTSIMRTPKLADCTPQSLLGALLTCTQLGLEPDDAGGRAYLIPYANHKKGITEVQLIVGYKGLMELARRSGDIVGLEARVVYDGDNFDYCYGSEPSLTHKPKVGAAKKTPVAVYAVARLKTGEPQFEVMDIAEVNAIRDRSRAGKSGPWVTDFAEMARKTVMRRLCKYLPSSPELAQAVTLDEQVDAGVAQSLAPVVFDDKPQSQLSSLDALAEQSEQRRPVPVKEAIHNSARADKANATIAAVKAEGDVPECDDATYGTVAKLWLDLSAEQKEDTRKKFKDLKMIVQVRHWPQPDAQDLLDYIREEHPVDAVA